jgi:pimeloyl-ACP methyl ester carboxylesterase
VVFALAILPSSIEAAKAARVGPKVGLRGQRAQDPKRAGKPPRPGIGSCPLGIRSYEAATFSKQPASRGPNIDYAQVLRPQTLYGIGDSPVGLAAYLLDHDAHSLELIARAFDGESTGLTRDDVLDNVTLFYLTNTAISSARLYWENKFKSFFGIKGVKGVSIPVAVSVFPDELYPAPRSWAERAYPKLIHYNKVDKGGHFAAWEQPQLFSEEIRVAFRSLR